EQALAVVAKIRRDVADLEAAVRRGVLRTWGCARPQALGKARVPARALIENGLRLRRLKTQRVGEIAVRRRVRRLDGEGPAKALDRLVDLARILEHAAEVVMESRVAGVDGKSTAQHVL